MMKYIHQIIIGFTNCPIEAFSKLNLNPRTGEILIPKTIPDYIELPPHNNYEKEKKKT